jgi:hypothetical protein
MFDDNPFVVLNLICVLLLQHVCLKRDCFTCYTRLYCSWKNSPREYLIPVKRTLELRLAFACKFLTWLLSCQINKRCFVIGVTRMVTQLPHFPIGHSLDSPGVMVPDEANLGYLVYLASMSVLGVLLISTKTLMHFQ